MLATLRLPATATALFGLLALGLAPSAGTAQRRDPVPLVTGKEITPEGRTTGVGSFPAHMLLSPDGRFAVVTDTGYRQFLTSIRVSDGSVVSQLGFNGQRTDGSKKKEGLYYGLAWGPSTAEGLTLYASRGAEDRISVIGLDREGRLKPTGGEITDPSGVADFVFPHHIAGLATDGRRLYAVHNNTGAQSGGTGSISIIDGVRVVRRIPVGGFPYAILAPPLHSGEGPADGKLFVTSERDGIVSVVDPEAKAPVRDVRVGDHPIALTADRAMERIFVANSGSDTVSVIDTWTDKVTRTIVLRPEDARGLPGATPTGLTLSPDEKRLYVTLGDMNAVAVVELPKGRLLGYIPTGWYPTAVVAPKDGKALLVACAKGVNVRNPNPAPADNSPRNISPGNGPQYIENVVEGTVSRIELPDERRLKEWTRQVIANNRISRRMDEARHPDFRNPGIEHIIYILKENRTYDQILGDLPQANGDPRLCFFPREVTPNQHALAERFVLLDNFYCCAEVSADGWNWSTAGMANEYTIRNAPYGYSGRGRVYDYEGQNNGVPVDLRGVTDVARPPGGYIWDRVIEAGLPLRNYGFFVNASLTDAGVPKEQATASGNQATKKALVPRTDQDYRQFDMAYADSNAWIEHNCPTPPQIREYGRFKSRSRYEEWKREFDGFVKSGTMPRFQMIRLPRDHTAGTSTGTSSPRAMVADNDYGVGQIVEAVSKSPFWSKTAIFVIEDDAQNGFDHVDAHRSVCYVISPFIKRTTVDHRFYNTDSVLRTMELILGVKPMNQYDAIAPPLQFFGEKPENAEAYTPILPARAICAEVNARTAYRSGESSRLNFTKEDAVPDDLFNDLLWHALRPGQPKPAIQHGLRVMPHAARKDNDDD